MATAHIPSSSGAQLCLEETSGNSINLIRGQGGERIRAIVPALENEFSGIGTCITAVPYVTPEPDKCVKLT
ncbi:Keratin, type I cytoskeletal 40 [Clarias magur]|uniref:Keratin, type I cytoskeletal 40 n=1 Tax=Clarias magur TaxID=1594786 RepID=A0A8J4UFK5_CLAMG|nr:Keratin, type I cytoskeletal 40 [Clarias magur]